MRAVGMPQYRKKLEKLGKDLENLDEPMKKAGEVGLAALRSYPPYNDGWKRGVPSFIPFRPGSKYKRTKTLQDGWQGRLTKGSRIVVRYSITNKNVKYMRYVQGPNQNPIHTPWWLTIEQWEKPVSDETTKIFQEFMKKITKGL
jgi:hypothetical protein